MNRPPRIPGTGSPRGRWAGRRALAVLLCGAVLLLAGCGLPSSSGIQDGRRVGDNVAPRARIAVDPPPVGASQDVIARDFVRAGTAFNETGDDQQVVGRSYLAPGSVDLWRPTALSTTVYDALTPLTIETLPSNQVRLTITAVATIDETGRYRELAPGTNVSAVFTMTKVDGEWRISLPPDGFGLWLDTDDFDRVFGPYRINYVRSGTTQLVADVRWFALGPRLPTALARAQTAAVPAYLAGVADTAVPSGTRLAVDAVNVDPAGIATVTLTNTPQTIEPARRRPMWAQFLATLTQAPGVTSVSIEVQGIGKIPVTSLPNAVSSLSDLDYDIPTWTAPTTGLLRRADTAVRIDPQSLDETTGASLKVDRSSADALRIPVAYTDLALSADGAEVAGVSTGRGELARWRSGTQSTVPLSATGLTDPSYASDGRLWFAGLAGGVASVWTVDGSNPKATPSPVTANWLDGREVVNLAVSPDATRVAVLSQLPNGTDVRMDLAGVVRTGEGVPSSLAQPYRQGEPLTHFVDVTWLDEMTLAVLARQSDTAPLRAWRVDVGQGVGLRRTSQLDVEQTLVKELPDATSITSRGGMRGLVLMTPAGAFLRTGNAWAQQPDVGEIVVGGN